MEIEGYEYGIQYREHVLDDWELYETNKFGENLPYPSLKSVKNALSQIKNPPKYSYRATVMPTRGYRIVARPYGPWEEM
jgi:hypothetical protein